MSETDSRKKVILRAAGRFILKGMVGLVRVLPMPMVLSLGRGLGTLSRLLSKKRYRVALKNLRIAYGDTLSDAERQRIARESFRHFGMFSVEVIKYGFLTQEEVDRRIHVAQDEFAEFEKMMEQKKGCLFLMAHLGNFEVMSRWITARGYTVIALARETRDRGTTELMTRIRERSGIQVITIGQSLKPVMVGLKKNACVAIICDQNAADVFVPFFGQPTGTVDGPARIALKMGTPMVFPYCVRDGKGGFLVGAKGTYFAEPTGDEAADVERVMTVVNSRLEESIREYPEQWLWFHDRWKSSPVAQTIETEAVHAS